MTIEIEHWTSGDAEEMHLFTVAGDARGAAYILGYNPKVIPRERVTAFLASLGMVEAASALRQRATASCPACGAPTPALGTANEGNG